MGRKTIILTENQFNEICGTNTAYLDNQSDYADDGTLHTRTDGAVSDGNGEKYYSEPPTGDDLSDMMAPETLWALLFRNGGEGLWGHWGSGLRSEVLDGFGKEFGDDEDYDEDEEYVVKLHENYDEPTNGPDVDEEIYHTALKCLRKTEFGQEKNLDDYIYEAMEMLSGEKPSEMVRPKEIERYLNNDVRSAAEQVVRFTMMLIDYEYYWEQYAGSPLNGLDEGKKKLQESNGELEDRTWRLDLDSDGLKKTYSYTNLTTKKTDLKQLLTQLIQQNAPKKQIQKVKSALAGVCRVLDRETGAIKQRKTYRKNMGFENQFQKAGGTKNGGNGKAHSKKITKDPNVGTGYITYA